MACDGDKDELCHCDMDELDCSNEALESEDEPLDTVDLDIKDEKFTIRVADFSKNEIKEIRKGKILQGHETQIEELNLGHNVIDKIDSGAFASLKNLKKLKLNDNSLYKLKKSFFQGLDQLHMLDLSFNKIKTLPEDVFSEMKNLKKLILDGNEIESMSASSFAGLDSLESLSLDDCGFKNKNQTDLFEKMPKLANLSLRGNPITEVPLAIKSLKTLNSLDLSETNIVELHSMSFKDEVKLNYLIMENMKYLATIQKCSFCGIDIETIILSNNSKLSYISPDAFGIQSDDEKKTETVKVFNIENCNITVLDEDLLIWDNLDDDQLHIGGNPIDCSCETSHLLSGFYFEYKNSHVMPKCKYPEKLNGKLLKDVEISDACEKMNRKGKWQKFAEILIFFLFFAGLSVGVYYIISTKKYLELIKTTPSGTPVHYSNLRNSANPDDRDALEADFQPRPAEV
ncbi:hypothetical protein WR25_02405 isoform B [Diploscapter pachys]|nr:hypothetical protein WR25_02405 isoform B [Diploscapter pachys]